MNKQYIAAGVRTDCQNLIETFAELKTLRYNEFAEIWRKMKFPFIYYERRNFDELHEFTEELFRIAKEFWLKPAELHRRVGGLYILYGLYLKQPSADFVKIRITLNEFDTIQKFHVDIRKGKHFDVNFVLSKLISMGAFHFCATSYTYGLEKKFRQYFESDRSLEEVREEPISYTLSVIQNDLLKQIDETLENYHSLKCKLEGAGSSAPAQTLAYIDPHIADTLRQKLGEIENSDTNISQCDVTPVADPGPSSDSRQPEIPWWQKKGRNHYRYSHPPKIQELAESSSDEDCVDLSNEKIDDSFDMPNLSFTA